jgi:hypothetical protein
MQLFNFFYEVFTNQIFVFYNNVFIGSCVQVCIPLRCYRSDRQE